MAKNSYAQAGVDLEVGNRLKRGLPEMLASTARPGVMGAVGGFGGLFELNLKKYKSPILVSSVDGVGTKLKVAFALNRHETIGRDLVNHCVNDVLVTGAEPLFFLDYLGTGKLEPSTFNEIIRGFVEGCRENRCALIGGETAQMPGFYQDGEYDLSGTIVGVVEKRELIDGRGIREGDALIGLAANGMHTNGYSLARRILFDRMKLRMDSRINGSELSVGEELLRVHRSYLDIGRKLLTRFNPPRRTRGIKGMVHVTGGGFFDNIPRVLPSDYAAVIEKGSWEIPPFFTTLAEGGAVREREMFHVFNMGIGMVLIVGKRSVDEVMGFLRRRRESAWVIGRVERGRSAVRFE